MSEINEYYITFQLENHFVEHTLFYSIIDVLNNLHIEYKREVFVHFRKHGCGYDRITRVYLYADFNLLLHVIKYYNEKG